MENQPDETLLDKPTSCKVSKTGKISILVMTVLLWISFPINLYLCSYYDKRDKTVSLVFLILTAISIPFYIAFPVATIWVWYLG